jgi:hypothetical protein
VQSAAPSGAPHFDIAETRIRLRLVRVFLARLLEAGRSVEGTNST